MTYMKFDPAKLEKLNDPRRAEDLRPDVMWGALALESPATMVEIGAGTGFFATRFAALCPGMTVYAADIVERMVEWMCENLTQVASGLVIPLMVEETHVPLPDGIADATVMINLHHELADPTGTYAEAFRLTSPGGRVLVADWADRETPKGPPLAIRASVETLRSALEGAGFVGSEAHAGLPHHHLVTATRER